MRPSNLELIILGLIGLLLGACRVNPTPTVVPIPTATYIATESPAPSLPPPTPTVAPIGAVVTDTLRVREDPSTSAKILGRLKQDTRVMLLARTDDNQWYAIEYPPDSGSFGWISSAIVIPDSPTDKLGVGFTLPPPPPGAIFANVKHLLNVRTGPSKDYDIIATISAGARITLIARSADSQWYQTFYPPDSRRRAWVQAISDILEFVSPPDQLAVAAAPPVPTPAPTPLPRPTALPGPPAGGRILASSNRGGRYEIYSFAENGAVRAQLTHMGDAFGARFSPDGTRIAFSHIVPGNPSLLSNVYVMGSDGSGMVDISTGSSDRSDSDPDWSPDGSRIVFVRTPRAGAPEIWIAGADGSGAHRVLALSITTGLGTGGTIDFSPGPRWSPDGGRVVYAAVARNRNPGAPLYPNIFTVGINGSGETQLTDNDLINSNPVWSPDGKQIIWSAKDFINRQNWRVMSMTAGGGNQRVLISQLFGDGNNGVQSVEWVGNRLLLAGWNGSWNAYFANADGTSLTAATHEGSDAKPTDWLP